MPKTYDKANQNSKSKIQNPKSKTLAFYCTPSPEQATPTQASFFPFMHGILTFWDEHSEELTRGGLGETARP